MKSNHNKENFSRRKFCKAITMGGITATLSPFAIQTAKSQSTPLPEKPATNISDALKIPRNEFSLPGRYPARVVNVYHPGAVVNNKPDLSAAYQMLKKGMLELTGAEALKAAWLQFVSPEDVIGLKVNPVAGKLLSTSLEITQAVIQQLKEAGISRNKIVIWDRREFQLQEAGFTPQIFPGIKITGTERRDEKGSFYDSKGSLYSEKMIDREWFYRANVEMDYDAETLPYMINQGKFSYFTKIVTREVSKIINIPVLKNAGSTVTLCLKNLAYGSVSNTARLHKPLWSETSAQVPCFPPLRDKVVLNIVDGLRGCYQGGPGANPQFFTNYNRLILGTDPVAVDRIGYEIVLKKRLEKKIQEEESPHGRTFMNLAETYGLGTAQLNKIDHREINLG